jgi:NAD(P)-dependent dehydrogenase (short-subunit alcohol dehydrogenase family)
MPGTALPSPAGALVVITGAGSGIGRALALEFARRGCRLALADIDPGGLAETAALLPPAPLCTVLDVADRAAVEAFAARVQAEAGVPAVVVNNAGVAVSQRIVELDYADLEWLMGINFWGVVYGTKAFLPALLAQRAGVIVNLSSLFGLIGWPTQGAYNAAKFAVRGFTEALRIELAGSGVRTLCVHPGGVRTQIARRQRFYVDDQGGRDGARAVRRFERFAQTSAEQAAAAIVRAIESGQPRAVIGRDAQLFDGLQRLFPETYARWIKRLMRLLKT